MSGENRCGEKTVETVADFEVSLDKGDFDEYEIDYFGGIVGASVMHLAAAQPMQYRESKVLALSELDWWVQELVAGRDPFDFDTLGCMDVVASVPADCHNALGEVLSQPCASLDSIPESDFDSHLVHDHFDFEPAAPSAHDCIDDCSALAEPLATDLSCLRTAYGSETSHGPADMPHMLPKAEDTPIHIENLSVDDYHYWAASEPILRFMIHRGLDFEDFQEAPIELMRKLAVVYNWHTRRVVSTAPT